MTKIKITESNMEDGLTEMRPQVDSDLIDSVKYSIKKL